MITNIMIYVGLYVQKYLLKKYMQKYMLLKCYLKKKMHMESSKFPSLFSPKCYLYWYIYFGNSC